MNPLATFEIDHGSGLPVWVQVKNRIAYLIGSGGFEVGAQLPTVRSLAVDLDISYNTVSRAYMDLEREGYISTHKGRGTFVAERVPAEAEAAKSEVEFLADEFIRQCRELGVPRHDIADLVQSRLDSIDEEK